MGLDMAGVTCVRSYRPKMEKDGCKDEDKGGHKDGWIRAGVGVEVEEARRPSWAKHYRLGAGG